MCGILGYSGFFDPNQLEAGLGLISHRGPDDSGVFFDKDSGVGLGHVRLSILDLSPLGHQPMSSPESDMVLVFNGEIYNYREIRKELESKGCVFRGHSDTEVLLNLYLLDGETMLSRLNGIFAFAIWDCRNKSLFIARDGLGVKPLYYAETSCGFAFGSEIKGLLSLVTDTRELDSEALHRYLSFLWCPGDGTPLKGVKKLSPGEALIVKDGTVQRRWSWYQLPAFRRIETVRNINDAIHGVETSLREAVNRQLVADVPVGAFLSGGLDSSAIVALAREQVPDIRCFTIEAMGEQDAGATDDLPYARKVAKHLNVPLDIVQIDAARMADDLAGMITQLDEPLADPAPLNVLYICRLAREQGIKVLLSGAGGDDLFTGYRRHLAVNYEKYWQWLPVSVRRFIENSTSGLNQNNALFRRLAKMFNGASLNGDLRLVNYFSWIKEANLLSLYSQEFRAELGDSLVGQPMLDFLRPMPEAISPLDRMLALEQRFFLSDHNLTYTDKMSMAEGVEVRVPFLDCDLVEYAQRIPMNFKQRGKEGKWVLKKAMEAYLPKDVIYRPKSGFGAPLRRWMRYELRPLLGDLLSRESIIRRGIFEPNNVQKLIDNNDSGKIDGAYILFSMMSIEIWCREYLDLR